MKRTGVPGLLSLERMRNGLGIVMESFGIKNVGDEKGRRRTSGLHAKLGA